MSDLQYEIVRPVTASASVLLAANPSPMTLDGTNTWLLRAPASTSMIVIDPGPDDHAHLDAIVAAGHVETILLTHGHPDHSEGAATLARRTGAAVRALDPAFRLGAEGLGEGSMVTAAGVTVRVWATPGHTADSLSFLLEDDDAVLTGDTILGRGTTVVAHPDGDLAAYLQSLERLAALGPTTVLPGHGPSLTSAGDVAQAYLAHRAQRLNQVRAAVANVGADPLAVVEVVYTDVDRALWPAAELSVRAQLAYLAAQS